MSDETCDVCGVILRGTRFYDSLYRKEIKCCSLACWREVFEAENTKHWIPKNIEEPPLSDDQQKCGNCRFYDLPYGYCRRHAPQCFMYLDLSHQPICQTNWPLVPRTDWCGEFEAKQASEEETG